MDSRFDRRVAGAMIKALSGGRAVSYQPVVGARSARVPAPIGEQNPGVTPFDAALSNLDYAGGPVMPSNTDYLIYWKDPAYHTSYPFENRSGLDRHFTDLAHDSGGHQNVDSAAIQYNDAAGEFANYRVRFGGGLNDTQPYPANGCGAAAVKPGVHCFTDAQMQAELQRLSRPPISRAA